MSWFWYVTRPDELMLDIDGGIVRGHGARGHAQVSDLAHTRRRLEAARETGGLETVGPVYIYRSATPRHFHVIVRLARPMVATLRYVWEMQLRSDLYRGRCNIMREMLGVKSPALLIAPRAWPGFYRPWNDRCECQEKHDFHQLKSCPAAARLRGQEHAAEGFFGQLRAGVHVLELHGKEGPMPMEDFAATYPIPED